MQGGVTSRGFLPSPDPAQALTIGPEFEQLDQLCRDLPSLLMEGDFRRMAEGLRIPAWPYNCLVPELMPQLRLYYMRIAFLVAGYLNQRGQRPAKVLPANLARPWIAVCALLQRPPSLNYDAYVLNNWRRRDPKRPVALGNLDTLQTFAHLFDERWYILVQVESEMRGGEIMEVVLNLLRAPSLGNRRMIDYSLRLILDGLKQQQALFQRLPERFSLPRFSREVRPYLSGLNRVRFDGVREHPFSTPNSLAEQGALVPLLEALLKSGGSDADQALTRHQARVRSLMPENHRRLIERVMMMPSLHPFADPDLLEDCLDLLADVREVQAELLQSGEEAEPSSSRLWMRQEVQLMRIGRQTLQRASGG